MAYQQEEEKAGRGQNAKRFGKMGLLAGAVAGLLSGGGIPAILQFALLGGGVSAIGGAVAGDKISPLLDKVTGLLPWGKKAPETPKVDVPEIDERGEATFKLMDEPQAGRGQEAEQEVQFRPISEMDNSTLENARAAAGASMREASKDMAADAEAVSPTRLPEEWVSREAEGKQANHGGSMMRQ